MGRREQRQGIVKTHTPKWVTHKWEDNYNCKVPPQGARGLTPHEGTQCKGPVPGRQTPKMFGFEGQQGLISGELEGYGK